MKLKNFILLYGVSIIVGLYTTFVLVRLWDWFVVPAFHVRSIAFWVMYGLTLFVSAFRSNGDDVEVEQRHKIVVTLLDACVPDDKREQVKGQLQEFAEEIWYQAGSKVFIQIVANSLTLGFGFGIHLLAS